MNIEMNLDYDDIKYIKNAMEQNLPKYTSDKNYDIIKNLQNKFDENRTIVKVTKSELKKIIGYVNKYIQKIEYEKKYGVKHPNFAVAWKEESDLKNLYQYVNQAKIHLEKYL